MIGNITKGKIQPLMTLYLNRPVKCKILKAIVDKEPRTISEIKRELEFKGEKYNYRTIWQHVQGLEFDGTLLLIKEEHETGKPVKIYLSQYLKENKKEFRDFLEIALDKKKLDKFKQEAETRKKEFLNKLKQK